MFCIREIHQNLYVYGSRREGVRKEGERADRRGVEKILYKRGGWPNSEVGKKYFQISKMWFGEMSVPKMSTLENAIRGTLRRGNARSENCPFGKLSFGELSVVKMSSGNCPSGKRPLRNSPRTILKSIQACSKKFMFTTFCSQAYVEEMINVH